MLSGCRYPPILPTHFINGHLCAAMLATDIWRERKKLHRKDLVQSVKNEQGKLATLKNVSLAY